MKRVRLHLEREKRIVDGASVADHLQKRTDVGPELCAQNLRGHCALGIGHERSLRIEPAETVREIVERDDRARLVDHFGNPGAVARFQIGREPFVEPRGYPLGCGAGDNRVHELVRDHPIQIGRPERAADGHANPAVIPAGGP